MILILFKKVLSTRSLVKESPLVSYQSASTSCHPPLFLPLPFLSRFFRLFFSPSFFIHFFPFNFSLSGFTLSAMFVTVGSFWWNYLSRFSPIDCFRNISRFKISQFLEKRHPYSACDWAPFEGNKFLEPIVWKISRSEKLSIWKRQWEQCTLTVLVTAGATGCPPLVTPPSLTPQRHSY